MSFCNTVAVLQAYGPGITVRRFRITIIRIFYDFLCWWSNAVLLSYWERITRIHFRHTVINFLYYKNTFLAYCITLLLKNGNTVIQLRITVIRSIVGTMLIQTFYGT